MNRTNALLMTAALCLAVSAPAYAWGKKKEEAATAAPAATEVAPEKESEAPATEGAKRGGIDANGDDKVSQEEYLARHVERFKRMDKDGDGFLSPEEMKPQRRELSAEEKAARDKRMAERKAKMEEMRDKQPAPAAETTAPAATEQPAAEDPVAPAESPVAPEATAPAPIAAPETTAPATVTP